MLPCERQFDQQRFVANGGDRAASALHIGRAARHLDANGIGTRVDIEKSRRFGAVVRFGENLSQRRFQGGTYGGILFALPSGGESPKIGATFRCGDADFRRGIAREKRGKLVRLRR